MQSAFRLSRILFLAPLSLCFSCGSQTPEASFSEASPANTLQIVVSNIKKAQGAICYTLVNERSKTKFPGEGNPADGSRAACVPVSALGSLTISFSGLPLGTYAVSLFHDVDGNGRLNTGLFGAPTEPLGLSTVENIPLRVPNFEECAFRHGGATSVNVQLKKIL